MLALLHYSKLPLRKRLQEIAENHLYSTQLIDRHLHSLTSFTMQILHKLPKECDRDFKGKIEKTMFYLHYLDL